MNTASNENIPNHLVWAILSTLFCCLPLGIVSIVYASKVDGLRLAGNASGAYEMSHKAKMWAIYSALAGPVLLIVWFVFLGGIASLASLSGVH